MENGYKVVVEPIIVSEGNLEGIIGQEDIGDAIIPFLKYHFYFCELYQPCVLD